MVVCILIQVFFRYVLNNALPWPDEAARFLMLWMTGFIAPQPTASVVSSRLTCLSAPCRAPLAAIVSLFLLALRFWCSSLPYSLAWITQAAWRGSSSQPRFGCHLIGWAARVSSSRCVDVHVVARRLYLVNNREHRADPTQSHHINGRRQYVETTLRY